jgi:leucyl aminopeptidase
MLLALVGCGGVAAPAESGTRYVTVDADAVGDAHAGDRFHFTAPGDDAEGPHHGFRFVEAANDVAILDVDASEIDRLSEWMHYHHRCGGYMLHDTLDEARAALRPAPARPRLDYSLDRAETVREVLPALDADRIHATIVELSAMKSRYYRSATGAAASTWLRDRWRSFTERPDVTVELVDHGYPQKSVMLTIPGTTRASEVVVLGGHLDSINIMQGGGTAPGADDDASGIATLTEVVRVLLAKDFRPARTIKVIAYAAEEVGLRGSLSIAKDFKKRKIDVVGALQLDMTNYQGSDKDIWLITDHTNADQNAFIAKLIDAYVGATWGTDRCGYACSDHASWHRYGFAASMPFESRSKDMNRKIHSVDDTLEVSGNNAQHAVKFARLAAAYAVELAKGDLGGSATAVAEPETSSSHRWIFAALGLLALAGLARRVLR